MDTGMLYTKDPVLLAEEWEHFLLNRRFAARQGKLLNVFRPFT